MTYIDSGNSLSADIPVTVPPAVFTMTWDSFDFNSQSVSAGTTGSQPTTLTNFSGQALDITDVQTTGDFTQTNDCVSSSPLAPDATCTIMVTSDPLPSALQKRDDDLQRQSNGWIQARRNWGRAVTRRPHDALRAPSRQ